MLASFTTTISPHLRALGYLDEAMALRRRYRLDQEAWQTHLDQSRCFVLSAAEKCSSKNKVIVLGSGLLLDVPLDELSKMFQQVVLTDVVCLPEARKQIRKYGNAFFVEHDVTNTAERLFLNRKQGISQLPETGITASNIDADAGLLVSLNILSQLWVIPRSFAARHLPEAAQDRIEDWCRAIVQAHYAWLRSLSCDVCLVADHEQVKRDRKGGVITRSSTIYDLALPAPDETWTWNIAPLSARNQHNSKELVVGGWYWQMMQPEPKAMPLNRQGAKSARTSEGLRL